MKNALPDVLAPNLSVVFCGINPAVTAAAAGHSFVSPTNRFWRVLHQAGFTPRQLLPQEERELLDYGYGLTAAVSRPTRAAAEVSRSELSEAKVALQRKIRHYNPRNIAFLGKAAYAAMTGREDISWGLQGEIFAGASVWMLPNPSGLNRGFNLEALVRAYREMRLKLTTDQS